MKQNGKTYRETEKEGESERVSEREGGRQREERETESRFATRAVCVRARHPQSEGCPRRAFQWIKFWYLLGNMMFPARDDQ